MVVDSCMLMIATVGCCSRQPQNPRPGMTASERHNLQPHKLPAVNVCSNGSEESDGLACLKMKRNQQGGGRVRTQEQ
jgi:hypothetical protein